MGSGASRHTVALVRRALEDGGGFWKEAGRQRITHKNDEAYVGALAVVRALRRPGCSIRELAESLPDTRVRDAMLLLGELDPGAPPGDAAAAIGCSGFVAESVPLAIYTAAWAAGNAAAAIRAAVECGGDTDTIASIAGQIAGQIAGAGGGSIPDAWRQRLPQLEVLLDLSKRLAAIATWSPPPRA